MATSREALIFLLGCGHSVEINGSFMRYFNPDIDEAATGEEVAISDDFECDGEMCSLEITGDELDAATLDDEGTTWTVGGHELKFYRVEEVATNPVGL